MTGSTSIVTIPGQLSYVPHLRRWLQETLGRWAVSDETTAALTLAVTELCTNTIRHGYGNALVGTIEAHLARHADTLHVTILDTAPTFIPVPTAPPPFDRLGAGGFGLFLMTAVVDEVRHDQRRPRGNRTLLVKSDSPAGVTQGRRGTLAPEAGRHSVPPVGQSSTGPFRPLRGAPAGLAGVS